jgi:hypothetical protein
LATVNRSGLASRGFRPPHWRGAKSRRAPG